MPWEIFRLANLTEDGRPVDIYSKSGGIPGYEAYILLLPDYQIGATLLVSGKDTSVATSVLLDTLVSNLVPSLDALTKDQAKREYAGSYSVGTGVNVSASSNASLELKVDSGPGLKIAEWVNNGESILHTLAVQQGLEDEGELDARLYPIGDEDRWRLGLESKRKTRGIPSLISEACHNWFLVDHMRYARKPVDEFVFEFENGRVQSVCNTGIRSCLSKQA
jgi:hypothetical protein